MKKITTNTDLRNDLLEVYKIALIANRISNHTETTAKIITAFKKVANSLKSADHDVLLASSWDARYLLKKYTNN